MTLLAPLGLLALLALPALVVLRLVGARRRARVVGSLLLWERAAEGLPRGRGRRLPPAGSLAVELAALGAAALALAHPAWLGAEARARVLVVVDRTTSMGAVGAGGRTAGARGLARLRERLADFRGGTRFTLRSVPAGPRDGTFTNAAALLAAAAAQPPTGSGDPVAAAVPGVHDRVLLVTDRLPPLADDDPVEVIATGTPAPNAAVTRLTVRRAGADAEVFVVLGGWGTREQHRRLVIRYGERTFDDGWPGTVRAGETGRLVTLKDVGDAASFTASIDAGDALTADDTLTVAAGTAGPARIAWLGPDAPPLRRALAAALDRPLEVLPPDALPEDARLTVVHREVPDPLPKGPVLVVDPAGPVAELGWIRAATPVAFQPAGPRAATWARVGLVAAAPRATGWSAPLPRGATVELAAPHGAAAFTWPRRAGPVAVVGLPPGAAGWSLTPSYPVFWGRCVQLLLAGDDGARVTATHDIDESDLRGAATGARPGRPLRRRVESAATSGRPWLLLLAAGLLLLRLTRRA